MIFDDYTAGWPGVVKAIDEFARENRQVVTSTGQTAKITKIKRPII